MASGGSEGTADPGAGPFAILLPVHNSGPGEAVIDSVRLIDGTQYPAPHLLSLDLLGTDACGRAFSVQRTAAGGYAVRDCGARDDSPLAGHEIGFTSATSFGYAAEARVSAPARGTCVVMTEASCTTSGTTQPPLRLSARTDGLSSQRAARSGR
jgi:hypothetical protein